MSILAVLEQRSGQWNRMSFETLAAAQQLAKELEHHRLRAAVLGQGMEALAAGTRRPSSSTRFTPSSTNC